MKNREKEKERESEFLVRSELARGEGGGTQKTEDNSRNLHTTGNEGEVRKHEPPLFYCTVHSFSLFFWRSLFRFC